MEKNHEQAVKDMINTYPNNSFVGVVDGINTETPTVYIYPTYKKLPDDYYVSYYLNPLSKDKKLPDMQQVMKELKLGKRKTQGKLMKEEPVGEDGTVISIKIIKVNNINLPFVPRFFHYYSDSIAITSHDYVATYLLGNAQIPKNKENMRGFALESNGDKEYSLTPKSATLNPEKDGELTKAECKTVITPLEKAGITITNKDKLIN